MSNYKEDQRQLCRERDNFLCVICKENGIIKRGTQCAHIIPQKKKLIKKYGAKVIHHHSNLKYVCDLDCNAKAMIHEWEYEEKVEKIKEEMNS